MRIGQDGRLLEWEKPFVEHNKGHRHISHLWGLCPGNQITADGTPELFEAARKSLDAYLLADTVEELDLWMNCEPVELLGQGLQMMSRKSDEMDERQKRGFVEVVIGFLEASDDKRISRTLQTVAEKICKENDFDDLTGRLK